MNTFDRECQVPLAHTHACVNIHTQVTLQLLIYIISLVWCISLMCGSCVVATAAAAAAVAGTAVFVCGYVYSGTRVLVYSCTR